MAEISPSPVLASVKAGVANRAIWALFFLSGISGLIYEVVWVRMSIRVFGCTVHATSVVLGAFMTGMALGSWLLGRRADRSPNPLRLYAILEMCAGASACLVPIVLPLLLPVYRVIYQASGGDRALLTVGQALLVFLALIVPTVLMGGTLPVLSAVMRSREEFGVRVAVLYGLNTLGAVFGTLLSGFVLIGTVGEWGAILFGVALHLAVALAAWKLSQQDQTTESATPEPSGAGTAGEAARISPYSDATRTWVGWAFALSGFAALGYEVVWSRCLSIVLRTSVYAFSGMLALYLLGIGIGSLIGRRWADRARDPIALFALLEAAVAFLSLLGFALLVPVDRWIVPPIDYDRFYLTFHWRLGVAAVVILPTTLLLGVLFPVVARCFTRDDRSVGKSVGRLYALNTLGCIAGSLGCGFVLLPWLGTTGAMIVLAAINGLVALGLLASDRTRLTQPRWSGAVGALLAAGVVAVIWIPDPYEESVRQRIPPGSEILYHRENAAATTTATGQTGTPKSLRLWVNGEGMTVLVTETKLMAYLPLLLSRDPKEMLIVCFGMGTTFRSAMTYGGVHIDTVELVPDVYDCYKFYHADGPALFERPNVRRFVDDGRNFLALSNKRYDVITLDPPPPIEAAGVVNFYSQEFHQLCREHLTPDGICCLWVPGAGVSEVQMILRTFAASYPVVTVWGGLTADGVFLMGSERPQVMHRARLDALLARPEVRADLTQWDDTADSAEELLGRYLMGRDAIFTYTAGRPLISDNHPETEFPLWRKIVDPQASEYFTGVTLYHWLQKGPPEVGRIHVQAPSTSTEP